MDYGKLGNVKVDETKSYIRDGLFFMDMSGRDLVYLLYANESYRFVDYCIESARSIILLNQYSWWLFYVSQ